MAPGSRVARTRLFLCSALVSIFLGTAGARAEEDTSRVALIDDPADTTILPRLRAELAGLGFDVRMVPLKEHESLPADLIDAARVTRAVAAFRVVISGERADVWIADRLTGKVVLREMLPGGTAMNGRVVALRALELFRASLVELEAPQAPQGELPAPAVLAEHPGLLDDPERFSFSADGSFLWSSGGAGPSAGVAASLSWKPSWLGLRLGGGSTLTPATLSRSEGSAEVTARWLGLDVVAQPRRSHMRWRPRIGLGGVVLASDFRGVTDGTRATASATELTFSPVVSADLGLAVHQHVRVSLGVAYLHPLHSAVIYFADKQVATFGEHILVANLGFDIVLP